MPWLQVAVSLQHLGLALIIGGLLALGAFTAPVLFRQFDRDLAGQAMLIIFRRYDWVLLTGMGLIVAGELIRIVQQQFSQAGPLVWARIVTTVALLVMVLSSVLGTNAQMVKLHEQNQQYSQTFNDLHKQSESLAKGQLAASIVLVVLSIVTAI